MAITFEGTRNVIKYIQSTTPTGMVVGDLWFKTTEPDKLYSYNGLTWVSVAFGEITPANQQYTTWPYAYSAGGTYSGGAYSSSVERLYFPYSGTSAVVGNLTTSNLDRNKPCNSSTHCYFMPGKHITTGIERITFPFDSGTATHVGNLGSLGTSLSNTPVGFNSSNYGFAAAAYQISNVQRITFPFDSGTASILGNLSYPELYLFECTGINSSTYGYVMGGKSDSNGALSSISSILFPFSSGNGALTGNLPTTKQRASGCNSSTQGYMMGGCGYAYNDFQSYIFRSIYPFTGANVTTTGNLAVTRTLSSGCNDTTYGYSCGGYYTTTSIIDRITFPFVSGIATIVGSLHGAMYWQGTGDATDFVSQFI